MSDGAQKDNIYLGGAASRVAAIAGIVGLAGLAASFFLGRALSPEQAYSSYLASFAYFLSLCLGALFFVMVQHVARAGWSVVLRRIAEAIAANLPLMALLAVPIVIGIPHLYPWANPLFVASDRILQGKQVWLNSNFFIVRLAAVFLIWSVLARTYFRRSVEQDRTGDAGITLWLARLSGPAIVLYAVTTTIAAFDLLMSRDPWWYSTIYGAYYFAGSAVGFFALLPVVILLLQRSKRMAHCVTTEHYHDMGKLAFAFLVFWAYIAFSQYLLIWYANLPEETIWYARRQFRGWGVVSLVLLFGHFVAPFLALVSRIPKRRPAFLLLPAIWILILHWVDLYWLVMPECRPDQVPLSWMDLTCFIGIGGVLVAATAFRMRAHALVPMRDPRLEESLRFENA